MMSKDRLLHFQLKKNIVPSTPTFPMVLVSNNLTILLFFKGKQCRRHVVSNVEIEAEGSHFAHLCFCRSFA